MLCLSVVHLCNTQPQLPTCITARLHYRLAQTKNCPVTFLGDAQNRHLFSRKCTDWPQMNSKVAHVCCIYTPMPTFSSLSLYNHRFQSYMTLMFRRRRISCRFKISFTFTYACQKIKHFQLFKNSKFQFLISLVEVFSRTMHKFVGI